MILTLASNIITVIFFFQLGKLIFKDIQTIELWGLAFLIGLGIESILLFSIFAYFDSVRNNIFWAFKSLEILFSLSVFFIKKPNSKNLFQISYIFSWSTIFWLGILSLFLLSTIYTLYYPVHTTDSVYYFDFRAKIMYLSHTVSNISIIPNWSFYPMFTSMVGLISRLSGSENPSFYYPLMFLSFALIFYANIRNSLSRNVASFLTLMMYSTPLIYWQSRLDGMTNLPYSIFLCTGTIYAIQYLVLKKANSLYLYYFSILGLALSKWVRIQEPFWILPLALLFLKQLWTKKWISLILGILLFYSIYSIWPNYITKTATSINGENTTIRISQVLTTLITNLNGNYPTKFEQSVSKVASVTYESLMPISIIFIMSLPFLFLVKPQIKLTISLFFILSAFTLLVVSTFYGTFLWSWMIGLENSLSRLTSFFVPLIWYYLSILISSLITKFNILKKNTDIN